MKSFFFLSTSNKKGSRSEKVDTMCIYLRLFLGMGIIWYFEILAFALSNHDLHPNVFVFTDTLNMCQVSITYTLHICRFLKIARYSF